MLNSYRRYKGTDTTIRENGSPDGVITAARISTAHIACLLNDLRVSFLMMPSDERAATTVGNSNTIPNVSNIEVKSDM